MNRYLNKKVLITTINWFTAPDGIDYKAVHGTLVGIYEAGKTLGFIPNRSHANWFLEIGKMTIMGCQVMYIIECETVNKGVSKSWNLKDGELKEYDRPTTIYITD